MPVYEYKCSACGEEFEVRQKFSDEPVKECIHCSGSVSKMISRSNFALKGGGWFKDGYTGTSKDTGSCNPPPSNSSSAPAPSGDACDGCPSAASKDD